MEERWLLQELIGLDYITIGNDYIGRHFFLARRNCPLIHFNARAGFGHLWLSPYDTHSDLSTVDSARIMSSNFGMKVGESFWKDESQRATYRQHCSWELKLVEDAMDDPHDTCIASTEYSQYTNDTHSESLNMERIMNNENKSFIPVDIGKSYLNEVIAHFKDIFGHLPKEYFTVDYENEKNNVVVNKSMENIDKKLYVKNKFVFKTPIKKGKTNHIVPLEVNYVFDNMLAFISEAFNAVIAVYDDEKDLKKLIECLHFKKIRKPKEKPTFKLLTHGSYGFDTQSFELKKFTINIHDNYNDDIPDEKIRNFINSDSEAGLCILHGKPGTGKTFYIRDLIKSCNRNFIYMNKECLNYINDASFIAFLVNNKDSVFIMEDCENVLADRTQYNNTISTLLNLSDGLLGDSLNNKFICTFNTDISNVDEALLRKGRMKVCYEFKYLTPEKANALAEKLNKGVTFDKEVPLCDVMNIESNGNEAAKTKKPSIGFGA